jgi:hypothetical protein
MPTTEDTHGEVDGRSVTWRYQRAENDQEGNFSWSEQDGKATCKYSALSGVVSFGELHLTMTKRPSGQPSRPTI